MRSSGSVLVMRWNSSLSALLPGTTTFLRSTSARVSRERPPLYLPLVWHSAQRALRRGATSWAKSIFFGGSAWTGGASSMTSTAHAGECRCITFTSSFAMFVEGLLVVLRNGKQALRMRVAAKRQDSKASAVRLSLLNLLLTPVPFLVKVSLRGAATPCGGTAG